MSKLIALIDGSIYAKSVCDHAAWIAGYTGAAVEIVHVLGRREVSSLPVNMSGALDMNASARLLEELADLDRQKAKLAQARGRMVIEQAESELKSAGVELVPPRLRTGDLVETVLELETDADLIIIGKRGEGADFAKLHLGSNLERVIRASHKPVLVASRAFKPIEKILIAFDSGPSIARTIAYLTSATPIPGVACSLIHAGRRTPAMETAIEAAAESLRTAGYSVTSEIVEAEPEQAIVQRVAEAGIDLLVMGAFGHSRLRSLFVGSTTTEMIRSCKIPILLFR